MPMAMSLRNRLSLKNLHELHNGGHAQQRSSKEEGSAGTFLGPMSAAPGTYEQGRTSTVYNGNSLSLDRPATSSSKRNLSRNRFGSLKNRHASDPQLSTRYREDGRASVSSTTSACPGDYTAKFPFFSILKSHRTFTDVLEQLLSLVSHPLPGMHSSKNPNANLAPSPGKPSLIAPNHTTPEQTVQIRRRGKAHSSFEGRMGILTSLNYREPLVPALDNPSFIARLAPAFSCRFLEFRHPQHRQRT